MGAQHFIKGMFVGTHVGPHKRRTGQHRLKAGRYWFYVLSAATWLALVSLFSPFSTFNMIHYMCIQRATPGKTLLFMFALNLLFWHEMGWRSFKTGSFFLVFRQVWENRRKPVNAVTSPQGAWPPYVYTMPLNLAKFKHCSGNHPVKDLSAKQTSMELASLFSMSWAVEEAIRLLSGFQRRKWFILFGSPLWKELW